MDARQALQAVTLLARGSADDPHAEELLRHALPGAADLITGMQAPVETLTIIFNAIPHPTVILAPAAAALCQRILNLLPASTEPAVRAYWLHNLGIRLAGLGRLAEALTADKEAVTIRRELAAASPDRYRPDLARSLNSLGVSFWELGRPAGALPVTEEAVAIFRALAGRQPGSLPPRPRRIAGQPRHLVLGAGPPGRGPAGHRGSRRDPPGAGRRQPGPLPPRPRPLASARARIRRHS